MTRILYRSFVLTIAVGLLVINGSVLFAQESPSGKERPPAGRNAKSNPDDDLENAAKNYVERRKQAEGEATRQRAIAEEARAVAERQRLRADEQARAAERARQSTAGPALTDSPKTMFAITLWAVRLNDSDKNGDESKRGLAPRTEIPTEFGSIDGVRALVNGLASSGRVRSSRELRVLVLDGQSARVQIGADKPQVASANVTSMGRSNSVIYRSIGTIVQAKPRIDSEKRIQIEIEYNASYTEPSNDVTMFETSDGKSKIVPEMIVTQQLQTTAKMKNGAAVLVKSDTSSGSTDKSTVRQTDLVILGCETVPSPE